MSVNMRRRLSPEGLDMRDGTPENRVFRVGFTDGITSPGAAFCAAPLLYSKWRTPGQGWRFAFVPNMKGKYARVARVLSDWGP
jgi:hypothetical protein